MKPLEIVQLFEKANEDSLKRRKFLLQNLQRKRTRLLTRRICSTSWPNKAARQAEMEATRAKKEAERAKKEAARVDEQEENGAMAKLVKEKRAGEK